MEQMEQIDILTNNLNKSLKGELKLKIQKVKLEKDLVRVHYEVTKAQEELRAFIRAN